MDIILSLAYNRYLKVKKKKAKQFFAEFLLYVCF